MEYQLINEMNYKLTMIEQVFHNRGFTKEEQQHYLNTTDKDILSPLLMMNVEEGAKMLIQHIHNNDNVLFIVDSDADGYTSSALMINYLYSLFPAFVENNISYIVHSGKQHGIIMDELPKGNQLIVCPDSSSNDYEQHQKLKEENIDVLVIDHHEADKISEYACIINNQLCDYPNKSLSGVGVAYKFCSYIDSLLGVNNAERFIDLVALGEISDVMNLRDYETRRIITKGLKNIVNPFFYAMVQKQNYSLQKAGGVNPFGVSFYITPQINATVRCGSQNEKILLFESMLTHKAYLEIPSTKRGCAGQKETIVEQACRNCTNIKNRQSKSQENSLITAENQIQGNNLLEHKILTIVLPKEAKCDKNLTGLIANKLMGKYQRPVLLLNHTEKDGEKWLEGSGRGPQQTKFENYKDFLIADVGLEDFQGYAQGHQGAFGFGIPEKYFDTFIKKCDVLLQDFDFTSCYKVDFLYDGNEISERCYPQEVLDLATLSDYWGTGVEEPLFAFKNVPLTAEDVILMSPDKNPTLKIKLPNGIDCIKFGSSEEELNLLQSKFGRVIIDFVCKVKVNEWNGHLSPQMQIEDYNIVKTEDYYF